MGDFLTRLAERTLGVSPVVQPLKPSMFAPQPVGSGWETDAPEPSGEVDRPQVPPAAVTRPDRDAAAMARRDDNDNTASARHDEMVPPEGSPPDARPAGGGPIRATARHEDRSNVRTTAPERFRDATGMQPGSHGAAGPATTRHDEPSAASRRVLSEDSPPGPRPAEGVPEDRITPRLAGARLEQERGPVPQPSPGTIEAAPDSSTPSGAPPVRESPPAREALAGRSDSPSTTPAPFRRMSDTPPNPSPSIQARSSESNVVTSGQENDRQEPSRPTTRHPQIPSGARPETFRHNEPDTEQRVIFSSPSKRMLPESLPVGLSPAEDESGRVTLRPAGPLVESGRGATVSSRPSPDAQASANTPRPVTTKAARPRSEGHPEWGSQESLAAAPGSSAPTVRVSIGRIEVRAITPPPAPPAQRPARLGPALSLDDYLKQRNGGQR